MRTPHRTVSPTQPAAAAVVARPSHRTPSAVAVVIAWLVLGILASLVGPAGATIRGGEPGRPVEPGVFGANPGRGEGPPLRSGSDQPVQLELVTAALPPVEVPSYAPPADPGGDQLVGNIYGCAATCITQALLHMNRLAPELDLEMTTNVNTSKMVWLVAPGPFIHNGLPAHFGHIPVASTGMGTDWNPTLPVAHDTSYRIVIAVTDYQGNVELATTIFTTPPGAPDQLVGNGSGCYYDCIESGTISEGPSYDVAILELAANTDVSWDVAVSTQSPFYINGNPSLVNQVNLDVTNQTASSLVGELTGLAGDTTYHVVVEAEDNQGNSHFAVGSFVTDEEPPPVVHNDTINFEKIHVVENGDLAFNGEIKFRMGVGPNGSQTYWQTGKQIMGDGDTHIMGYESTIQVQEGDDLPIIIVNAEEKDIMFPTPPNTCGAGQTLYTDPLKPECAGGALSIATGVLEDASLEWIQSKDTCDNYGVPGLRANWKCALILSHGTMDSDYVQFEALVSFDIN